MDYAPSKWEALLPTLDVLKESIQRKRNAVERSSGLLYNVCIMGWIQPGFFKILSNPLLHYSHNILVT